MQPDRVNGRPRGWMFALVGGLVAGTFDITYACVFWGLKAGVTPQRVMQSVAKGLLGPAAFQGGMATAALGLLLHYFIATSMSFTYYLVALRWPLLRERPLPCGAAYGLLLYGIIVPLSAARGGRSGGALWIALSIAVHMFLIGVPIAMFAGRAFSRPEQKLAAFR